MCCFLICIRLKILLVGKSSGESVDIILELKINFKGIKWSSYIHDRAYNIWLS